MVMLVVAADESVMPQTREHFQICRLLDVPAGVIVLTKADVADPDTIDLARLEVRELTAGSFLADAPIVARVVEDEQRLDGLRQALVAAASAVRERDREGPTRMPIDRVFSVKGFGTVVTGTLVSGTIREDAELVVLPRDVTVKVRGVQVHGHPAVQAGAGNRVAVNLGGVDVTDLARGDTVCAPGAFEPTRRLDGVVDVLGDGRALRHGARVRFHHGTIERLGRVAIAAGRRDGAALAEIAPGSSAYARIRLEAPAVLTRGDRFILRSYSPAITIGGGVVLDPHPPRSGIRNAAALARYRRLDMAGPAIAALDSAVQAFIDERGAAGLSLAALLSRAGISRAAADTTADRLDARDRRLQWRTSSLRPRASGTVRAPARGTEGAPPIAPAPKAWLGRSARTHLRPRGAAGVRVRPGPARRQRRSSPAIGSRWPAIRCRCRRRNRARATPSNGCSGRPGWRRRMWRQPPRPLKCRLQ